MKFGELLKELRIGKEKTLRDCSIALGWDASNWSKVERGVTSPPKDVSILEKWAVYFGLDGAVKQDFFDRAAVARQEIPLDLASDEAVIAALPAFFRAVRGKELEGEQLERFMADLRNVISPDKDHSE